MVRGDESFRLKQLGPREMVRVEPPEAGVHQVGGTSRGGRVDVRKGLIRRTNV